MSESSLSSTRTTASRVGAPFVEKANITDCFKNNIQSPGSNSQKVEEPTLAANPSTPGGATTPTAEERLSKAEEDLKATSVAAIAAAAEGRSFARRLREEQWRHQRLADAADADAVRWDGRAQPALTSSPPRAVALAWQDFSSPGPTQCSKRRVFRQSRGDNASFGETRRRPQDNLPEGLCWTLVRPSEGKDEKVKSDSKDNVDETEGVGVIRAHSAPCLTKTPRVSPPPKPNSADGNRKWRKMSSTPVKFPKPIAKTDPLSLTNNRPVTPSPPSTRSLPPPSPLSARPSPLKSRKPTIEAWTSTSSEPGPSDMVSKGMQVDLSVSSYSPSPKSQSGGHKSEKGSGAGSKSVGDKNARWRRQCMACDAMQQHGQSRPYTAPKPKCRKRKIGNANNINRARSAATFLPMWPGLPGMGPYPDRLRLASLYLLSYGQHKSLNDLLS